MISFLDSFTATMTIATDIIITIREQKFASGNIHSTVNIKV